MHAKFEALLPGLDLTGEICAEVYDIDRFLESVGLGPELELDARPKSITPDQCGDAEYELDPRIPFTD